MNKRRIIGLLLACAVFASSSFSFGARVSDVRATLHNFSNATTGDPTRTGTVPQRNVVAATETQVCVFCHTPHAATAGVAPLWNRKLSTTATYTPYTSSSLDAEAIQGTLSNQANGSSKLCLSCHDGAMAIGNVNVLNGNGSATVQGSVSISMTGTGAAGTMPPGSGDATGFTRKIGADLTNDHPISVTYDTTLATRDGELRTLDASQKYPAGTGGVIGVRSSGYKPKLPLEPTGQTAEGQIQCATCHDPHLKEADSTAVDFGKEKFLRLNRFQATAAAGNYNQNDDIICLSCHTKSGTGGTSNTSWAYSAHANKLISDQTPNLSYTTAAANQRQFPANLPVWQAACLNCHDTHTVTGSRRLLREGTNDTGTPKSGGTSAIEETCYQCHDGTTTVLNSVATVPNIKNDFSLTTHMPIAETPETHDIGGSFDDSATGGAAAACNNASNGCGKDMLESRDKLGLTPANRHAECPDCHNPHRVVKFKDFRGNPAGTISGTPDASGTHAHQSTTLHSNVASGVLRGAWGVEPVYGAATNPLSFHSQPSGYQVKRGDPGSSASANVGDSYVTREYQICLKCHSDYGYPDNNVYPAGNRPTLGAPGTLSGANGLTMYTNQAKEFQAPASHQGENINKGNEAGSSDCTSLPCRFDTRNHRSWHPVMGPTNRTLAARGITGTTPWRAIWNNQVGNNTMYCSDCHGSNVTSTTNVRPNGNGTDAAPTEDGSPWGPHGSTNDFILKGAWTDATTANPNLLCFKCHVAAVYSGTSDSGRRSAFYDSASGKGNLHNYHASKVGFAGNALRCTWCHVAVPHGWKNRSLLVNLNDVGEEAGQGAGSSKEVAINSNNAVYSQEPYYYKAKLKIVSFATSGDWRDSNCGSAGKSGTGLTTGLISGSGGSGNNTNTGKDWMTSTCNPPP